MLSKLSFVLCIQSYMVICASRNVCYMPWYMHPYLRLVSIADRKAHKLGNRLGLRCVLIWKHGWDSLCEVREGSAIFAVKSHMFNLYGHPRNSWGCCEVWKQKTQVRNAPLFWRYSFGLTLLCER